MSRKVIRANILEEIHKSYIMYQLLKALKYMHSAELLHRDIKAQPLYHNTILRIVCPGPAWAAGLFLRGRHFTSSHQAIGASACAKRGGNNARLNQRRRNGVNLHG